MDRLDVPLPGDASSLGSASSAAMSRERRPDSRGSQKSKKERTVEDSFHTENIRTENLRTENVNRQNGPRRRRWRARPQSPGLEWYKCYDEKSRKRGRVLVIDYVKRDLTKEGMRKVASLEISDIEGLRKFYDNPTRGGEAVLRVFHVQNADWAVKFMLKKFYIRDNDLVGSNFGQYATYRHPERRGGKPLLKGKTWATQHDPWRGISKTAFGIDYLRPCRVRDPSRPSDLNTASKMYELNCYDENDDSPIYGHDVFAQRMSVYIQHKEQVSEVAENPDIQSPYQKQNNGDSRARSYFPVLENLDNGNTIIIFENSISESIDDTMIAARDKWESRWRRLPFYLAYENQTISTDDEMALQCMKMILQDVWKCITECWGNLLDLTNTHMGILEDKIYEFPADESRADEIWTNSSMWLKTERLMYIHVDILNEFQNNLQEIYDDPKPWLDAGAVDFHRLQNLIQEDLVKPTASLSDLMYKSVEIRDSRHSLELSYSMWRLSWITFIFLPLTFTVGFFGMNVDTFVDGAPQIRWFFVTTVPLMCLVMTSWYILKHQLARSRQTPYSRGIYERLFHDLANAYPTLWSRGGPRTLPRPVPRHQRAKWWLIQQWNAADKTVHSTRGADNDQFDGLGSWNRAKRILTRKWTEEIGHEPVYASAAGDEEGRLERYSNGIGKTEVGIEEMGEMMGVPVAAGMAVTDPGMLHVPNGINLMARIGPVGSERRDSVGEGGGGARPSSRGSSGGRNSGLIVEEQKADWLQSVNG